jgi:peptidoglycan hydrolase-like protein with peptidoglycan-binding domain
MKMTKALRTLVLGSKFGFNKVIGGYSEKQEDGTVVNIDDEHSTIIYAKPEREAELRKLAIALGKKYEQDSVLFVGSDRKAVWIFTRPDNFMQKPVGSTMELGDFHPKQIGVYFTKIGKKNFSFVMKESEEITRWSQNEIMPTTIEMRGFDYDCQRRKVKDGPWTKWGMLPDSMISYDDKPKPEPEPVGDRDLKNGDEGPDVKQLQENLIELGFDCGPYGADGEFGDCTEMAVEAFQRAYGLPETGVYDAETRAKMDEVLDEQDEPVEEPRWVEIVGGDCYVRTAPNKTNSKKLGVAHRGDKYPYQGETTDDGWNLIMYKNQNAWVSGKYSRLVE